jgi:hypothetical protein
MSDDNSDTAASAMVEPGDNGDLDAEGQSSQSHSVAVERNSRELAPPASDDDRDGWMGGDSDGEESDFLYDAMPELDLGEINEQLEEAVRYNTQMASESTLLADYIEKYLPPNAVAEIREWW